MLRALAPRTQSLCAAQAVSNALLRHFEIILCPPIHKDGGILDRTGLATSAAGAPLSRWQRRFEGIAPGSVLRLSLADAAAEVAVEAGEHEAIELWSSADLRAQRCANPAHGGSSLGATCGVASGSGQLHSIARLSRLLLPSQAAPGSHTPGSHAHEPPLPPASAVEVSGGLPRPDPRAPPPTLLLAVRAPSRFLSIEAASGGGRVHVEAVQEGSLRLDSGGGDISVPKVWPFSVCACCLCVFCARACVCVYACMGGGRGIAGWWGGVQDFGKRRQRRTKNAGR